MNPMLNYDPGSRLLACHGLLQPCCRFAGGECKTVNATSEQLHNRIIYDSHVLHNILKPYGSVPWPWKHVNYIRRVFKHITLLRIKRVFCGTDIVLKNLSHIQLEWWNIS